MESTARDIMKTDVRTVGPEMTLPDLDRFFLETGASGFPVVEADRLLGIVSRSDVIRQLSVEQSVGEMISGYYHDVGEREISPAESFASVARHLGRQIEKLRVRDVMIENLITVAADAPLLEVAQVLVARHVHRVPVVEDGRLLGIISSIDFVRLFAEKRVGPI